MFRRLQTLVPYLLALLPWLWVLWPLLSGNRFYVSEDTDTLQIQYPLRHLLGTSMRDGQLPLWTPLLSNGYPLMAEGEVGAMYPLNLFLFRYFEPYDGYQMAMAIAPLVSLIAAYYYFIHRKHTHFASLLGASCFAFGGYMLGHLRHLNHLQAMSMLPMTLLFAERYLDRRRLFDALMTAAALSVAAVAGIPQLAWLIGVALVILVAVRIWEKPDPTLFIGVPLRLDQPWRWYGQALLLLPISAVIAGLIAAPQLLLTWDLIPLTERSEGLSFEASVQDQVGPAELLHFVAPHAHGIPAAGTYQVGRTGSTDSTGASPGSGAARGEPPGQARYWETLGYVGVLPLAFALMGAFLVARERRLRYPLVLVGIGVLLAMGTLTPVYRLAWELVPGMQWFRVPGRFLLLVDLGLAMLAAAGVDFLVARLEAHPHAFGQYFAALLPLLILGVNGVDLGFHGSALMAWMSKDELLDAPTTRQSMPNLGPYRLLSLPGGAVREGPAGGPAGAGTPGVGTGPGAGAPGAGTGPGSGGASASGVSPGGMAPRDLRRDPQPFLERRALLWRDYNVLHDVRVVGAYLALPFARHRMLEQRMLEGIAPDGAGGLKVSDEAFNLMQFLTVRMVMSYFPISGGSFVQLEDVPVPGLKSPVRRFGIEDPYPIVYLARKLKKCGPEVTLKRILAGRFGSGWDPCIEGVDTEGDEPEESAGVAGT